MELLGWMADLRDPQQKYESVCPCFQYFCEKKNLSDTCAHFLVMVTQGLSCGPLFLSVSPSLPVKSPVFNNHLYLKNSGSYCVLCVQFNRKQSTNAQLQMTNLQDDINLQKNTHNCL